MSTNSSPLSVVDEEVARLENDAVLIQAKLEMLHILRMRFTPVGQPTHQFQQVERTAGNSKTLLETMEPEAETDSKGMGLAEAVRKCVEENPGSTTGDIVRLLDGKVKTKSKDPKRAIYQTVFGLVKSGKLKRRDKKISID